MTKGDAMFEELVAEVKEVPKARELREEATRKLDEKVEAFKKKLKGVSNTEPKLEMLRAHFGPSEMQALWQRLPSNLTSFK